MTRSIDYGNLMHRAMRGLIQEVLNDVAAEGLPGQHHFFITFDTMHPDVEIADWLSDRYPGEMTIVLQHWFDALVVTNDGFSVTLNFGDNPEPLYIPYDAIKTFVDPSVEFGLRFETQDDGDDDTEVDDDDAAEAPMDEMAEPQDEKKDTKAGAAQVVSLDSFRK
ncbi:SspB family protein [Flavimaricola marinus]|uniref:Stringent starvation protein B n=1 Tax=Flavimaricola marinus TaxID=1819565 RepID=A0A238LD56_9RHOB|nr:ClpXP protease specificity-enhancing factor SspB [Flavimaricola marinus]SMY07558.1 Stringent starvation protein B [Flavimaricola marinus]